VTSIAQSTGLASLVRPLSGTAFDYDAILDLVGDARVVLIGEASHGTHEFYRERAAITRRLIIEKGFTGVAVEADWPDAYRVNTYVRGQSAAPNAERALAGFTRFPTWMWRNTDVVRFVEWLREHNASLPNGSTAAGFYGLDLYSLYTSIDAVIEYLDRVDPDAAARARNRYACFDGASGEEQSQRYGWEVSLGTRPSCEDEAIRSLLEMQRQAAEYARRDGRVAEDDFFHAAQNARLVKNAEQYYRSMFGRPVRSWNLRDQHMAETLAELLGHLDRPGMPAKVVVWEHNSHVGDARATDMGLRGELNVGQLARQTYGSDAVNIGFTTYDGEVTAAADWGDPCGRRQVRPALAGSFERAFHDLKIPRFLLITEEAKGVLQEPLLERAIGVIYRPESERTSHYFRAWLTRQFDAVLHFDRTNALTPLESTALWDSGEPPETYPTGQ
jgi:erythromycin esterase-like protein